MPTEIDFGPVRRQRETGFVGSGQPMKNFQDSTIDLSVYDRKRFDPCGLATLGPVGNPARADAMPLKRAVA